MSPSSPDRFQREIDDIVRLAEKRLERQARPTWSRPSGPAPRRRSLSLPSFNVHLPRPEVLGGWGLALLLIAWLLSIVRPLDALLLGGLVGFAAQVIGIFLLVLAIVTSLVAGRRGGGAKMWRGERVSYGSPYGGSGLLRRIRRYFGGR